MRRWLTPLGELKKRNSRCREDPSGHESIASLGTSPEPGTTGADGPSVLRVRVANPTPDAIAHDVIRLLNLRRDLFNRGVLVTLDKARARVRVLPLGPSNDSSEPG